jgi:hypothetical protein
VRTRFRSGGPRESTISATPSVGSATVRVGGRTGKASAVADASKVKLAVRQPGCDWSTIVQPHSDGQFAPACGVVTGQQPGRASRGDSQQQTSGVVPHAFPWHCHIAMAEGTTMGSSSAKSARVQIVRRWLTLLLCPEIHHFQ